MSLYVVFNELMLCRLLMYESEDLFLGLGFGDGVGEGVGGLQNLIGDLFYDVISFGFVVNMQRMMKKKMNFIIGRVF